MSTARAPRTLDSRWKANSVQARARAAAAPVELTPEQLRAQMTPAARAWADKIAAKKGAR